MDLAGIGAGFEVARIGDRCLATETRHTPEGDMLAHYRIALDHDVTWIRDGLPPDAEIEERMGCAYARCLPDAIVFDLCHYWEIPDPTAYAARVARAHMRLRPSAPLWVCLINEMLFHPVMRPGEDAAFLARLAVTMLAALRSQCPDVRVMTSEPAHSLHEVERHGLVEHADVIGLNIYPHAVGPQPHELMLAAHRLYGKPIVVSETGLHLDHGQRWRGINCKGAWLRYMLGEIEQAKRAGADVRGLCWYPIVNTPSWNHGETHRWDHGLIREDLSVDPALSAAIMDATGAGQARAA